MGASPQRDQLLSLLRSHAVLHGDFLLSSGGRSTYYIDARRVTLSAAGSPLVGAAFLAAFVDESIDAAAGLTVGADPIVSAIAVCAGLEGRSLDALIVRKQPKQHGAGRRIEGPWREGMRVAVVDDTSTTGASTLEAVAAIREVGGHVAGVWQLIDREQGARQTVEAQGLAFHALFSARELLDADPQTL